MGTIDIQVGAGADDCRSEHAADFSLSANSFTAGYYNSTLNNLRSGARFLNVTIPQGSTIDVAYMTLRCNYHGSGTINTNLMSEDTNDAPTFSTLADYNARSRTSPVAWEGIPDWTVGQDYSTPSLVIPVQTVINRPGWVSGNALVIFWENGTGSNARNAAYSRDASSTYAPRLHIEYSTGGATARTSEEAGAGSDSLVLQAAIARGETAGGGDARQSLLAALARNESGSGIEQSLLNSLVAKLSAETGSGLDISGLVAALAALDSGLGVDAGWLAGLKSILSHDLGVGGDALKALIGASGSGADMKLPGRQGHVTIPSKGVSL